MINQETIFCSNPVHPLEYYQSLSWIYAHNVVAYLLSTQENAEVAENVSHALLLCGIRKKGSHQSMRGRTELKVAELKVEHC